MQVSTIRPTDQPIRSTLTPSEAFARLGVGRTLGYQLIARGQIPSLRLGRRVLIPAAQFERLLAGELPQPADDQHRQTA